MDFVTNYFYSITYTVGETVKNIVGIVTAEKERVAKRKLYNRFGNTIEFKDVFDAEDQYFPTCTININLYAEQPRNTKKTSRRAKLLSIRSISDVEGY